MHMENLKLMLMDSCEGQVSINEASFLDVEDCVKELISLADKGKQFYEDMLHILKRADVNDFIKIIRSSETPQEAKKCLVVDLDMGQTTANMLLNLPLSEITVLDESHCLRRIEYYTKILDAFENLL